MITVWSDDHRFQRGDTEVIEGRRVPCVERPERAELILGRIREAGLGEVIEAEPFGLEPVHRVHEAAFVAFLRTAFDLWQAAYGEGYALPFAWPPRGVRPRLPESLDGQLGYYCFDGATPITSGTWRAASAAVNVALTAQKRVAAGARAAFALCRPPGHHAAQDLYGGYCFLNNAAVAAQAFADGGARVAVLDLDYHHGNGTQAIFYDRRDVLFVSIHADPLQDFPFFSGYAVERGRGDGEGFTLNLPLPLGTDWPRYEAALEVALGRVTAFSPDVLLVSLGLDTYVGDPIARFALTVEDYARLGRRLARPGLPTLFVLEGGYALGALGELAIRTLSGFCDP